MRKNYSCTTGLRTLEGLTGGLIAVRDEVSTLRVSRMHLC